MHRGIPPLPGSARWSRVVIGDLGGRSPPELPLGVSAMRSTKIAVSVVIVLLVAGCAGAQETARQAETDAAVEEPAATDAPTVSATTPAPRATPTEEAHDGDGAVAGADAVTDDTDDTDDMDDMGDMAMGGAGFGEPADPADADREIDVAVGNALEFVPDQFEVAQGEVITFVIANTGDLEHEFVLGDEQAQQEMAEAMAAQDEHAHSGEMSNAVTVHGGETAELTWRFTTPGVVLVGCHVAGHWEAGMRGTVLVE